MDPSPLPVGARITRILGYGLALLPAIGALVPIGIGTGTESRIAAILLVAMVLLGLWIARLALTGRADVATSPLHGPVGAFALVWLLATLWSNVVMDPRVAVRLGTAFAVVQLAAVVVTVVSVGVLLLGANVGRDVRYAKVAVWSVVGVGVLGVAAYYVIGERRLPFLNTNGVFTLWAVSFAYGQAMFNGKLSLPARAALLVLAGAFVVKVAVFQTIWLSGWMPTVLALGVITLLRSWKLALVGAVAVAAVLAINAGTIYHEVIQAQVDEGSDSRLDIWAQAYDLLSQHLVFGTGPAGYAAYYMTLYRGSGSSLSTHSNYVDIIAQTGVVGTIVFVWLALAIAYVTLRAVRRWRDGFEGGYAAASCGALVGVMVAMALGDWVLPFVYNQGIEGTRHTLQTWVYLGLAAGLASVPRPPSRAKAAPVMAAPAKVAA